MTYFHASAHGIGGFTVAAEYLNGEIDVTASHGRGFAGSERFTAAESGIHTPELLTSYCQTMIAQWAQRRRQGKRTPFPEATR